MKELITVTPVKHPCAAAHFTSWLHATTGLRQVVCKQFAQRTEGGTAVVPGRRVVRGVAVNVAVMSAVVRLVDGLVVALVVELKEAGGFVVLVARVPLVVEPVLARVVEPPVVALVVAPVVLALVVAPVVLAFVVAPVVLALVVAPVVACVEARVVTPVAVVVLPVVPRVVNGVLLTGSPVPIKVEKKSRHRLALN